MGVSKNVGTCILPENMSIMSINGCKIHQLTRGTNLLGIKSPSITPQNFAILGGMKMVSYVLST